MNELLGLSGVAGGIFLWFVNNRLARGPATEEEQSDVFDIVVLVTAVSGLVLWAVCFLILLQNFLALNHFWDQLIYALAIVASLGVASTGCWAVKGASAAFGYPRERPIIQTLDL